MAREVDVVTPAVHRKTEVSPGFVQAGCILLFAAASALVFRGAWEPLMTIQGADASLWVPRFVRQWTTWMFIPRWFPHFLAGIGQQFQFLSQGIILMLLTPPYKFHGFEFMLDAFLAGAFMFLFLRDRGMGRFGSLIGGFSYQLGNGLLTAARQGALWKFDTACWVPLFLLFFTRVLEGGGRRLRNAFFAGVALGLQFLGGEVQLAYYVCLLALAFFLVESVDQLRKDGREPPRLQVHAFLRRAGSASIVVLVGIAFAAEVFVSYATFLRTNQNVGATSDQDAWNFATEFSFPPEQTLSLMFTGDMFSEGRHIGNTGARIERMSDDYLGVLVLLFAAIGLVSGLKNRYFFAIAALAALLISFGKFFPIPYHMVYALPLMSGLRNPHKWLFVTALCISILAGMGADYWHRATARNNRRIAVTILTFAAFAALAAFLSPAAARAASRGGVSWSAYARPVGVLVAGIIVLLTGRTEKLKATAIGRGATAGLLILLLAGDLAFNASKYLVYYNYRERYDENEVAQFFRSESQPFRVKLWTEDSYLRNTVTEVLPYYGIDAVDAIMSRRPARYSRVFQAVRDRRLPLEKFLQLFNVRYLLSASPIETKELPLTPVRTFGRKHDNSTASYLYAFLDSLPRVYAVEDYRTASPDEVLGLVASEGFDLHRSVALEKEPNRPIAGQAGEFKWKVDKYEDSPQHVTIEADLNEPGLLVLLDAADDYWHVRVDGREDELLRANYLMRAVALSGGTHHVEFVYEPPLSGFVLTAGGWLLVLSTLTIGGIQTLKKRWENPN